MKKKEIIDKILQYHPNIEHYHGCDEYKSGFEEEKCTGIVSALVPTMEVLKKAVELGCNLLVVHEPIYYQTPDFPDWKGDFENSVQKEKKLIFGNIGLRFGETMIICIRISRILFLQA